MDAQLGSSEGLINLSRKPRSGLAYIGSNLVILIVFGILIFGNMNDKLSRPTAFGSYATIVFFVFFLTFLDYRAALKIECTEEALNVETRSGLAIFPLKDTEVRTSLFGVLFFGGGIFLHSPKNGNKALVFRNIGSREQIDELKKMVNDAASASVPGP